MEQSTFSVFGLTGYWYGLCACVSALAYLCVCCVLRYRRGLPLGTTRVYGLLAIPLGLLFARLFYCVINLGYFTESILQPWLMLNFWDGGLSMTGLLCGMMLAAFLASRILKARFGSVLDATMVPLGLLMAGLRIAEGFTTLGVGRYVEVGDAAAKWPWLFVTEQLGTTALTSLAVYRYEAVMGLFCFAVMLILSARRSRKTHSRPGDLAMISFSLYGATQVIMESLRNDGHMLMGFVRFAEICAIGMPILATILFSMRFIRMHGLKWQPVLSWIVMFACLALGVMLEFSLDGRLSIAVSIPGMSNLARDYIVMAIMCLALFLTPYRLWRALEKAAYHDHRLKVSI